MGKSAKKSTKVEAAVAVTAPVIASGKGKRGAEKAIEKVSAKKLKKNDGTVQAIEKLKSETKIQKKNIKKKESSSSEDESSEEEEVKAVKPSTKNPTVATNGSAKKDKPISSSDSSSDDSESEEDTKPKGKVIAPSAKKAESSSESDSSDDSDLEKDTKPKGKVIAPAKKMESSSDSDSDSSNDSDDVPKAIQGKKVASKADTSSDNSSEEENDKKTTVAVNKSSAAAKKKDDSSSDEDDDSDDSSEEDESSKVAKVPITVSKNVPVASEDTESDDSSDDSESDDVKPAAKKPASANGKNSKQSEQSSDDEENSEDEDEDEDEDDDEDKKPSKGQNKNDTDVEMVDAVTPKTVKKAPQTPATPQAQSGGSKTLFVGNLPFSVEQAHVENFFKDCKVSEVRFSTDRDGNFKGYGHVEFATEEDAQKALALNGQQLLGRELKLDLARERGSYTPGNERTPFQKAGNAQGSTMFVGGIDRNGDENEVRDVLEKHFAACGEVTRVSIPPDRESGGLRGIAYIDFTDSGSLNKALELGGPEFNGYTLKVDEAKPRDNSGSQRSFDRPSGGRGNGGRGRFGRSGGRDGGSRSGGRFGRGGGRDGGRGRSFNRPNLAAAGTGKKTTFDD